MRSAAVCRRAVRGHCWLVCNFTESGYLLLSLLLLLLLFMTLCLTVMLSDRYILLGNHRDAWMFGAVDPTSGTAVMMEVSRVLAKLVSQRGPSYLYTSQIISSALTLLTAVSSWTGVKKHIDSVRTSGTAVMMEVSRVLAKLVRQRGPSYLYTSQIISSALGLLTAVSSWTGVKKHIDSVHYVSVCTLILTPFPF